MEESKRNILMAPIESIFFIIVGLFALIAVVRGYANELGNTMIILVLVFLFTYVEQQGKSVLEPYYNMIFGVDNPSSSANLVRCILLQLFFVAIVFGSYSGRTFNFGGSQLPPPEGTLISILVGLLNGYLVGGTLWHYLHKFRYPYIPQFDFNMTVEGNTLLNFLPQTIFPNPIFWLVPILVLIILRIRG